MATMLLSSIALPRVSAQRTGCGDGSVVRMVVSSSSEGGRLGRLGRLGWRRWGEVQKQRPCRGGVVCEVAVELGGSRSSGGEERKAEAGARVRVRHEGPLKVYHVPKNPELDINGMEGELKEVVTSFKGKPVSATLPYKVLMVLEQGEEKRKFFVHLKADEFEVVE